MSLIKNLVYQVDPSLQINIPQWELSDTGIMVLQGASGSGKSTIIKLLLGLVFCKELNWILNDVNIAKLPTDKRNLSVVFQNYALFPHMTARQNIEFAASARNLKKDEAQNQLETVSRKLGIQDDLHKKVSVLSGGEQQRVALARSLMGSPQFLFLDEPFSAIDDDLKAEARKLVRDVVEFKKIPCLLVTHDSRDREALSDKTFYLKKGCLV